MKKKQSKYDLIAAKPNFLIGSKDGVKNIYEYRITMGMLSCMYMGVDITKEFSLDVKYVLIGKTDSGENYKHLKAACKTVVRRCVNLLPDNARGFNFKNIVSTACYEPLERTGKITVQFNPLIVPHILEMFNKNNLGYTKILMKYATPIRSLYSVRLYEYLIRNRFRHKFITPLDELRELLGVPKNAFSKWYEFDRNILKLALKNMKKYTNISFEFTGIRSSGRNFVAVEFQVFDNTPEFNWLPELVFFEDDNFINNHDETLEHVKIVREHIWENSQQEVLDSYTKERIKYYHSKLNKILSSSKKINDPKAYFYVLLKNDKDNYTAREQAEKEIYERLKKENETKMKFIEEMEKNRKKYEQTISFVKKCWPLLNDEDQKKYMNSREIPDFVSASMREETAAALFLRDRPDLFEYNLDKQTFLERYERCD